MTSRGIAGRRSIAGSSVWVAVLLLMGTARLVAARSSAADSSRAVERTHAGARTHPELRKDFPSRHARNQGRASTDSRRAHPGHESFSRMPNPGRSRIVVAPGMRIAIDPRTGHPVRPSPEQTRAMGATSAHAAEAPLEAVSLPGGGWLVRLDERYMQSSIARRDSTGGFHIDCVPGGTQLERIPRRPWTPPSRPVAE